ncbi:MAG: hypothetical protein ACLRL6_03375 [Clostridium sp.]
MEYHRRAFEKLCSQLEGYVDTIIISFVDMYGNRQAIRSVYSYRKCADICWMSERHWAVSLSLCYIYKHVQRILIFPLSYSQGTLYGS